MDPHERRTDLIGGGRLRPSEDVEGEAVIAAAGTRDDIEVGVPGAGVGWRVGLPEGTDPAATGSGGAVVQIEG